MPRFSDMMGAFPIRHDIPLNALEDAVRGGDRVTVKVERGGAVIQYHGRVSQISNDLYQGQQVEITFLPEEVTAETQRPQQQPDRVSINEEEQHMPNAIIHPNPRTRTADISIEVREDIFLDAGGEEVERGRGEEMPVYIGDMPLDVLHAIQHSGRANGGTVNMSAADFSVGIR